MMLFYYDINGILTEIRASMKEPAEFSKVMKYYILIMFFLASIMGILGTLAFGKDNKIIIFANFEKET